MNNRLIRRSVCAPESVWDLVAEIGGGNISEGVRQAAKVAHNAWAGEQRERWSADDSGNDSGASGDPSSDSVDPSSDSNNNGTGIQ